MAARGLPRDVLEGHDVSDADQLLLVDAGDGGADGRRQCIGTSRPWPHDENNVIGEGLRHRHVDLNEVASLIRPAFHLARDADNLTNHRLCLRRRRGSQSYSLPDRRTALKMTREGFVRDGDGHAVTGIALVEGASRNQRQIERGKIGRTHDLIVGAGPLTLVHRWVADDLERQSGIAEQRPAERHGARPRDVLYTRNGPDLALDLGEELLQRFIGWIFRTERIHQHGQHALRAVTAIEGLNRNQRPQQQSRAEEQKNGGGDLCHHEQSAKFSAAACRGPTVGSDHVRRREAGRLPRGSHPKEQADNSAAAAQKVTTRVSNVSVTAAGSSPSGISEGATLKIAAPTPIPSAPPITESTRLSVIS